MSVVAQFDQPQRRGVGHQAPYYGVPVATDVDQTANHHHVCHWPRPMCLNNSEASSSLCLPLLVISMVASGRPWWSVVTVLVSDEGA